MTKARPFNAAATWQFKSWFGAIMASVTGAVTALGSRLGGFGTCIHDYVAALTRNGSNSNPVNDYYRVRPGLRLRQVDPATGHVSSKRRCHSFHDEPARWIDEKERMNVLRQRLSFVAALKHTLQGIGDTMIIDSHQELTPPTSPDAASSDSPHYLDQDPFEGPQLARLAEFKTALADAVDVLGGIYSAEFLATLKNMMENPQILIEYPTVPEDIRKIKSTIYFLEDFPHALHFILRSARISRNTLRVICFDLMALLEKQPIPALVKGPVSFTRLGRDESALRARPKAQPQPPKPPVMPGSFPADASSQVAQRPAAAISDDGAPSPPLQSPDLPEMPEKGLSPNHRTIPIEIILHHIIPAADVATYGKSTPDGSHRKKPTPRSILRTRLKSSSPGNSKRLQKATKMKSVHFASPLHMPSPEPKSRFITPTKRKLTGISDPFYWRYRTPHSPESESPILPDSPLVRRSRAVPAVTSAQINGCAGAGEPGNTAYDNMTRDGASESTVMTESPRDDTAHHVSENRNAQQETQPTIDDANNVHRDENAQGTEDVKINNAREEENKDAVGENNGTGEEEQNGTIEEEHNAAMGEENKDTIEGGNTDTTQDDDKDTSEEENKDTDEEDDIVRRRKSSILKTMIDSINAKFPKKPSRPFEDDDSPPLLGLQRLHISGGKKDDIDEVSIAKQLEQEAEEARIRAEAEAKEEEERRRAEEERLRRTGGLRRPNRPLVAPLSEEWTRRARSTLHSTSGTLASTPEGTQLRQHDFATVVPATEWLNDEIVNGSLQWLDRYINARAGVTDSRSHDRKFLACSTFMWERINQAGPGSTERALRRVGVNKNNFLNLDAVLLPLCERNHWTLIVIRPSRRTIAHMNSMSPTGSPRHIEKARQWVEATLKEKYVAEEWTVANHDAPLQTNGYDCGVHTITNGMCIALGLNPIDAYASHEMPLQRLRIAAMLLNGGFEGDFDLASI